MFRFWSSESKACANNSVDTQSSTQQHHQPQGPPDSGARSRPGAAMPATTTAAAQAFCAPTLKRKSPSDDSSTTTPLSPTSDPETSFAGAFSPPPPKRVKTEIEELEAPWPRSAFGAKYITADSDYKSCASLPTPPLSVAQACHDGPSMEEVTDIVQYQFSHEILLKHSELRLIEQEMAKCQIAMEQLRRCHLIPYPTTCPTPQQMLDISSGRGPPVRTRSGASVPKWSAPFGVTDGPYARHYAKWLIPDPVFDGLSPASAAPGSAAQQSRSRNSSSADVRSTRNNSCAVPETSKGRPSRASAGQKLQALANAYPPARSRAGPCVLKRSDGLVVKLVCVDCNRDDFSSTQGFINHCRIAHKREYKSHDVAAMHCGQPLDAEDPTPAAVPATSKARAVAVAAAPARHSIASSSTTTTTTTTTVAAPTGLGQVHPLARADKAEAEVLLGRMEATNKAYCHAARGAARSARSSNSSRTSAPTAAGSSAAGSQEAPFLAAFLAKKQFSGDIAASVLDAKAPSGLEHVDWDAMEEDTAPAVDAAAPSSRSKTSKTSKTSKAAMSKTTKTTLATPAANRAPAGSRPAHSLAPASSFHGTAENAASPEGLFEDEAEAALSPLPLAGNNAPSLVSDDGEYDESDDDGSDADSVDVDMDVGSASDVTDYNSDENDDVASHHGAGVKLRRDGAKHVTFVSPVKGSSRGKHN